MVLFQCCRLAKGIERSYPLGGLFEKTGVKPRLLVCLTGSILPLVIWLILAVLPAGRAANIPPIPDTYTWGVTGIVYAVVRVGDVIYVGGEFSGLVSPDRRTTLPASNLAAFDVNTGQPTAWRPFTDGRVLALAASIDGSEIYVGGAFRNIDGVQRLRFAAISPGGSLLWSLNANDRIGALAVSGDIVYVGGDFTQVQGVGRQCLGALRPPPAGGPAGILLPWSPGVTSTRDAPSVTGLAVANGDVVAIGHFTPANGAGEINQARFDAASGLREVWESNEDDHPWAITTDGVNFYVAFGGGANCAISWGPAGQFRWRSDGDGDVQAIAYCAGRVVIGGHWAEFENQNNRALAFLSPATGAVDPAFEPRPNMGLDRSVWAICGSHDKLHVAGAFTRMADARYWGYCQFPLVDTDLPSVPGTLIAAAGSAGEVTLRWGASTDDTRVDGYQIFRNGSLLTSVGAVTNHTDFATAPQTSYDYQVRARDSANRLSALGNHALVTTAGDGVPPTIPGNLHLTALDRDRVDLAWLPSTDNVALAGYDVFRDGVLLATLGTTTAYFDTTVWPAITHRYAVRARDAQGNVSVLSGAVTVAIPTESEPPTAPANLIAITFVNAVHVDLTWEASTDNYVVAGYVIYRTGLQLTTVGAVTNFSDASTLPVSFYDYQVRAVDSAGNPSPPSNTASATTPAETAPPTPTGLIATVGNAQVTLSWNASARANSYIIKRSTAAGGPYTALGNVVAATSYTDVTAANGTTYFYVVSAVNSGGESANSAPASGAPSTNILPNPWLTQDIGAVAATGSASYNNNAFTVVGSGADIWETADEFRYVYRPANGNCSIVARVASVQNTNPWAKSGVMIRETLNANSRHVSAFVTPGNGVSFQRRTATGGSSASNTDGGLSAPYWVRVVRSGDTFTVSRSANGVTWTTMGSVGIPMATNVYIGLAVTSHSDGTRCTSTIDNMTATPQDLTGTPVTSRRIDLTWGPSENAAVVGHEVIRNDSIIATLGVVGAYSDTTVSAGTLYTYQVRAFDASGSTLSTTSLIFVRALDADTQAPAAPPNLLGSASGSSQVNLRWTAATDNRAVVAYDVYRGGAFLAALAGITNFSDTTVLPLTSYSYQVRARDAEGNASPASNTATVTTPADTQLPTPPPNLVVQALDGTRVGLVWDASIDNVGVAGYRVLRDGALLATVGSVTAHVDNSASALTIYHYQLQAFDGAGNVSPASNVAAAATPGDTQPPSAATNLTAIIVGQSRIDLQWAAAVDNTGIAAYRIMRNGELLANIGALTSFSDTNVVPLIAYQYLVQAVDGAGNVSAPSNLATVTIPSDTEAPTPPSGLIATAVGPTEILLNWNAATDNVGVTAYRIGRDNVLVAVVGVATNYLDTTAAPSTTYSYRVRALDAAGNLSLAGNRATATTPP